MRRLLPFVLALALSGCDMLGGAWTHEPEEMDAGLGPGAKALLDEAFGGVEAGQLRDRHTHVVGTGSSGPGTWVNPKSQSWAHPIERLKALIYLSASGVKDEAKADGQYLQRLQRLIDASPNPAKHFLLAFDDNHAPGCAADKAKSTFYVSNDYVYAAASKRPDIFIPVVSVHPYRTDAVARLEYWAKRGVGMVKWLPNAQGVNACDRRLKDYYCAMKRLGMTLNSHTGLEQAVEAGDAQALGNPQLLRYALDLGVKVIAAHAASLGEERDLDKGGAPEAGFKLLMRMMEEEGHQDLLFADISATPQYNRLKFDKEAGGPLLELLKRENLHARLVNGSDYPLPAVNWVVHLGKIKDQGLISAADADHLREIYNVNPLLFDFALKRTLKHPETGKGFPPSVFTVHPALDADWTPTPAPPYAPPSEAKRCPVTSMPSFGDVWALCGKGRPPEKFRDKCE